MTAMESPNPETSKHCQACGHPTTPEDPAVQVEDSGARIHESHTTDPRSGFYGVPVKQFR